MVSASKFRYLRYLERYATEGDSPVFGNEYLRTVLID
jgi:hypothetical protein